MASAALKWQPNLLGNKLSVKYAHNACLSALRRNWRKYTRDSAAGCFSQI
jgi:hypothetical protein